MTQKIFSIGQALGLGPLVQPKMRIFLKERLLSSFYNKFMLTAPCIFIHVPKTAGTSMNHSLFGKMEEWRSSQFIDDHLPYFVFERINPDRFHNSFKFAFVRNPWDRLLSAYCYLCRDDIATRYQKWARKNLGIFPNFQQFVRNWVNEENIWSQLLFFPQSYFILDRDGRCKVDFVGRYENLARDFQFVCAQIGINPVLGHLNDSQHRHYSEYYDDETRGIVSRVYARDIYYFKYGFLALRSDELVGSKDEAREFGPC